MKKISIFAAAMGVVLGLTSCESTTDPKLQLPDQDATAVSFQINDPAYATQELQLQSCDDATLAFQVYSQPDYGFPAAVSYTAQVSLTGNWDIPEEVYTIGYDVVQKGEANHTVVLTQKSLANAITYLNGFTKTLDKETGNQTIYDGAGNVYTGPMEQSVPAKVYLRAIAQIGDVESSRCYSNAVELSQVKWFINFREAGFIYLIGKPQGWDIANGSMMLFENDDEIGTKIYHGHFNIDANPLELGFRFYTELGDWDKGSIGAAAADGDNKDCEFNAEGIYSGDLVMGKGNFQFPTWPGGEMWIIVDLNSMKITVSDHEL